MTIRILKYIAPQMMLSRRLWRKVAIFVCEITHGSDLNTSAMCAFKIHTTSNLLLIVVRKHKMME